MINFIEIGKGVEKMEIRKKILVLGTILVLSLQPMNSVLAESGENGTGYGNQEQRIMAILYQQYAAEHRALYYQAYNVVNMLVDKAIKEAKPGDKPLAIIMDLDETVIDNNRMLAEWIVSGKEINELKPSKDTLVNAPAMPGAVELLQSLASKGIETFYVTNRYESDMLKNTLSNLKTLKFPMVDEKHLFLATNTQDKQDRFHKIAKNHNVIIYMGDCAGDWGIGTFGKDGKERQTIIDAHKKDFGTKIIVLPNSVYGDWESALAPGYSKMTTKQKADLRRELIMKK
jgi:5'-nucleotidase (lipoprotein e(P4) family)